MLSGGTDIDAIPRVLHGTIAVHITSKRAWADAQHHAKELASFTARIDPHNLHISLDHSCNSFIHTPCMSETFVL